MNSHSVHPRDGPSTLVEVLRRRALEQPDRRAYTFLTDGEEEEVVLTYRNLDLQARAIAAQLQNMGAAGERALLLYPPSLEYIVAFYSCLYAGVVAVPTYPPDIMRLMRSLPRFLAIVNDAQPAVILTIAPILGMIHMLPAQYPDLQSTFARLQSADLHWLATDEIANSSTGLAQTLARQWQEPALSRNTLAFLQYTSGSTAQPKGVMLTHGNLLYNGQMIQTAFEHTEQSTFVGWLPLYHDMGLIGDVLQPLQIGAHSILMSPLHFLQRPFRWLHAISRYRARTSGAPNFAYDLCVRKITPDQRAMLDLSSWQIAFNGAEPVRSHTLEQFASAFEPCGLRPETLYPCYGLAEATLFVTGGLKRDPPIVHSFRADALAEGRVVVTGPEAHDAHRLVSCGRTWLDQRIVVVDPDSLLVCPQDKIGEIWISGPNVAQGYWQRPKETELTFGAYLVDTPANGSLAGQGPFLRTGDLGFLQDGELYISGRLKDLIIIDGLNHYPQDIELAAEQSHPELRPGCSAAFSIDVAGREQLVVAAEVGRRNPDAVDVGQVIKAIRHAISEQHDLRVHDIVLLQPRTIPKTSSGKIQRRACREGYLAGSLDVWEG